MEESVFFYDSYAIFEIAKGNNTYSNYIEDVGVVTTKFNLMEAYYRLLVQFSIDTAELYYNKYREFVVDVDDYIIKKAMQFRAEHKAKDLSYVDCIGYVFAKENKIKFLTGDKQFEGMENVEFVK